MSEIRAHPAGAVFPWRLEHPYDRDGSASTTPYYLPTNVWDTCPIHTMRHRILSHDLRTSWWRISTDTTLQWRIRVRVTSAVRGEGALRQRPARGKIGCHPALPWLKTAHLAGSEPRAQASFLLLGEIRPPRDKRRNARSGGMPKIWESIHPSRHSAGALGDWR